MRCIQEVLRLWLCGREILDDVCFIEGFFTVHQCPARDGSEMIYVWYIYQIGNFHIPPTSMLDR